MTLTTARIVFLVAVILFTAVTSWTDLKWRRIPNKITVPMCLAGFIWQIVFHGGPGLLSGLYGFAIGFGILFVLWMIGSAGGGDVKLLGALSVWLGPALTLKVLLASLVFVIAGTFGLLVGSMMTRGWRATRRRYGRDSSGTAREAKDGHAAETSADRQTRRVMAFAMPVALATWSVLLLFRQQW